MQRRPAPKIVLLVASVAASAMLSGCAGLEVHAGTGALASVAAPSSSPKPAPTLAVVSPAPWNVPLEVGVSSGTLASVAVTDKSTQEALPGTVDPTTGKWVSTVPPTPGAVYRIAAVSTDGTTTTNLAGTVRITTQPASAKIHFGILPGTGAVVGVNAPIVIRFDHDVTRKQAVENALTIASTTPVVGAWHWISSSEIHFRPQNPWPTHIKVRVTLALTGVQVSATRYGSRTATSTFSIGDAHETIVNDATKTFTFKVNGKVLYTWPTSLGKPQYVTRTGNYIVLEKDPLREMTSCAAKITCDKTSKDYYDLQVQYATRLSWSGTFIHAAPWSVAKQGLVDSSHGCIHLTIDRAKTFFGLAQYGDIVRVLNTGRPITDLVQRGDPGASDWNTTWAAWLNGSAVGAEITTEPLAA
ncbi:MAG TPA: Ig-like domain-containing protein [Candidatus Angelobacter sp.]|nr:Ig-like domain-containing protein [Candidatus Angelobacter sp.]